MHNTIILLMLIPLFGAGLCLLGKALPQPLPFVKSVSLLTLGGGLLLVFWLYPTQFPNARLHYTVGDWFEAVSIPQVFDGLAWLSCVLVLGISLCALLFAIAEDIYEVMFYVFFLMSVAGMIGVILSADLFNMFVCFEILAMAIYVLIAYLQTGRAVLASFEYLLLSSLGVVFMLIGILILYQQTGSLSLLETSARFSDAALPLNTTVAIVALVVGISLRVAFIPFHTWLPDAYTYAPHPVSALLSGVAVKVSFLAVWRIICAFRIIELQTLFVGIGALTALFAVIGALSQSDCKRLLAWHSISQMGYILTGFGVGTALSMTAAFAHIINHALFKSLLFLCVGSIVHVTGERNLKKLGNLAHLLPWISLAIVIGACSITGLPPFNGFISKKLITASVKSAPVISALLWAASVGTVASFLKFSMMLRPRSSQPLSDVTVSRQLSNLAYLPLTLLAVGCVVAGLAGRFIVGRLYFLLSGDRYDAVYPFYSLANLLSTVVIVGFGFGVYRFVVSQSGTRLAKRIQHLQPSFNTALLLLIAGFVAFALLVMF